MPVYLILLLKWNIIWNINTKNQHIYISGDINIDFLKYDSHPKTEEYLNMLYSHNLVPLITKPTRITDHTAMALYRGQNTKHVNLSKYIVRMHEFAKETVHKL